MIDDSDSSDDDALLKAPTFRRSRRPDAAKQQTDRFLKDALTSSKRHLTDQQTIKELRKEELKDDELMRKTTEIQEINRSSKKVKLKLEDIDNDEGIFNQDGALDKQAMQILSTIRDTQLTSGLGMKTMLFQDGAKSQMLPSTVKEAMDQLDDILTNSKKDGSIPEQICKDIEIATKNDDLDQFLECFRKVYERHGLSIMSLPLQRWLFLVACSSLSTLSDSACRSLLGFWDPSKPIQPGDTGFIWTLQDFESQFSDYFGFRETPQARRKKEKGVESSPTSNNNNLSTGKKCNVNALERFLQLYDRALRLGFIHFDVSHLESVICTLLLASVDPVVQNSETDVNVSKVQEFLYSLFDVALQSLDKSPSKEEQWMDRLAKDLCSKMEKLGPGDRTADDYDDKKAFLSQAALFRVLFIKDQRSAANNIPTMTKFQGRFTRRIFIDVFGTQEKDWDEQVQTLISKLGLDQDLQSSSRWTTFGGGCLAIEKLATTLEAENRQVNDSSALAILLAFVSSIETTLAFHSFQLSFKPYDVDHDGDDDDDDDDDEEEDSEEDPSKAIERQAMAQLYVDLAEKLQRIKSSTHRGAMSSGTLRRVNEYSNILRLYFTEEKKGVKAANKRKSLGDTLDSWISRKKPKENQSNNS